MTLTAARAGRSSDHRRLGLGEAGPDAGGGGRARAYLYGIAYGFGILFDDWTGRGDGTATTTDAEGATLIYTGDEMHPFDAVIPCTRHRRHRTGVTWPADLNKARDDTAACSAFARATVPPVIRRPPVAHHPRRRGPPQDHILTRPGEPRVRPLHPDISDLPAPSSPSSSTASPARRAARSPPAGTAGRRRATSFRSSSSRRRR
ncbi:hypothetical protein ACFQ3Z_16430 [Streptomyces nogalater]